MNTVSYFEIQADDPQAAVKFYGEIFGWEFIKEERLPIEYYRIENAGPNGALLKRPTPVPKGPAGTNAYVCSIQVENFDEVAKKILDYGGLVALEKFAVPGKCWQGYFLDNQSNTFGIFEVDESAR
jgi:predicted enzyme related to lactoylglutathione lyase